MPTDPQRQRRLVWTARGSELSAETSMGHGHPKRHAGAEGGGEGRQDAPMPANDVGEKGHPGHEIATSEDRQKAPKPPPLGIREPSGDARELIVVVDQIVLLRKARSEVSCTGPRRRPAEAPACAPLAVAGRSRRLWRGAKRLLQRFVTGGRHGAHVSETRRRRGAFPELWMWEGRAYPELDFPLACSMVISCLTAESAVSMRAARDDEGS